MEQQTKRSKKWIWMTFSGAAVLLTAAVICLLWLRWGRQAQKPPAGEETAETTAGTVPSNPYAPEDFVTKGDYLTCVAGDSVLGIDVSVWQGQIDWEQVKAAGVEFVMIRIGWRGSEQGLLAQDECAQANYEGAKAAGLKVGGYFFSQAISVEEAVEEARYALQLIEDWELDMPLAYDWEYINEESRTGSMDARTLTDCTKAFCETVKAAGYEPMIYFNEDQSHKQMYLDELTQYGFWLAMYESQMDYPYKVDMWQHSCTGTVPGIEGNVDLNLFFLYE